MRFKSIEANKRPGASLPDTNKPIAIKKSKAGRMPNLSRRPSTEVGQATLNLRILLNTRFMCKLQICRGVDPIRGTAGRSIKLVTGRLLSPPVRSKRRILSKRVGISIERTRCASPQQNPKIKSKSIIECGHPGAQTQNPNRDTVINKPTRNPIGQAADKNSSHNRTALLSQIWRTNRLSTSSEFFNWRHVKSLVSWLM